MSNVVVVGVIPDRIVLLPRCVIIRGMELEMHRLQSQKKGLSRSLGTVRLSSNTVIKKYTGVFVPRLERESLREEGAENK